MTKFPSRKASTLNTIWFTIKYWFYKIIPMQGVAIHTMTDPSFLVNWHICQIQSNLDRKPRMTDASFSSIFWCFENLCPYTEEK